MKKSLLVGCLVLLVAGCSGKTPSSTASSNSSENSTKTATAQTKESAKTSSATKNNIELVSDGAEPKQQLRFAPPANTKQTVQMTMKMDAAMSVGGQTQPTMATPPMQMTMEAEVTKVDTNGDIYATFSYTDADIVADAKTPPELASAMRSQLKKIVGLQGSLIIDNQGNTKDVKLNLPDTADPNTKQMLQQIVGSLKQISSPVPTEAVGVGAKWRHPTTATINGMNLKQTATYELIDLKDNVATMQVNVEQEGTGQQMNPQGLPPGASVNLKSLNSEGNGKVSMALNQILPVSSAMTVKSNMEMEVKQPDSEKETTMGMQSTMEINLESK